MTREAAPGHNAVMESEAGSAVAVPSAEPAPRRRRIGWKGVACVGPIAIKTIYDLPWFGVPLSVLLLGSHPVLLSALRGCGAAMIASGGFAEGGKSALAGALLAPAPIC